MPTLKDIARECSVSANTVSCVLNNKPGEVSAATRERVLEAVRRLGYRPNAAARRMVGKRTHTIGIADRYTPSSLPDPYKAEILEPLIRAARSSRWDVLYYSGHATEGGFPAFLDGRSDGLLCFTGSIEPQEVTAIRQSGLPIVFIGEIQDDADNECSQVDVDNEAGAYLAVSHLTALGHRRIAMMHGPDISGDPHRVQGYRRALADAGLAADEALLYPTIVWQEAGYQRGKATFAEPANERPTAVFCFNDVLAFGLLQAAADCGVRVPEEMSVVGFDDVAPAALSTPPLTTVRQPLGWIGERAVEILIGVIEGSLPSGHRELVEPHLVIRSSTAPPPPP